MPKLTPVQEVKQRFGSKEELARQLLANVERPGEISDEDFQRKIKTASNRQLLRMHEVHDTLSKRFGSKEKLVDALVAKRFPKGNEPYRTKLLGLRPAQLLDLFRRAA